MTVLVTGGTGFVGSHLCEHLARGGERVIALGPRPLRFEGEEARNIEVVTGDVTNFESLLELVKSKEVKDVVVSAAITTSGKAANIPLRTLQVNVLGLANTLECARMANLRVISLSSAGVYGRRPDLRPIKEDDPTNADTVYRRSKAIGEDVCELYRSNFGMSVTVLRLGTIYGPRSPFSNMPSLLLHHALMKQAVKMANGADMRFDYVYVGDVAKCVAAVHRSRSQSHDTYNVGSGRSTSPIEIAAALAEIFGDFGYEIGPGYSPGNDWVQGPLDISAARIDFGYAPVPLRDALSEYADWLRHHPDELKRHEWTS